MSQSTSPICPRCARKLPGDAPKGLCPNCLAAMNFATETNLADLDAAAVQPPLTPEELNPHFPQLEIMECLGRGGMGVVYKARQKSLNRMVALKLLAPERATDGDFAERFATEAQALARLNHPNIVTVHDFGQAGGFYYLLMEFVDGVNLRQLLRTRKLDPAEALSIVPPVCEALQYAHDHGIVHRDIKPENLLLDKSGRVKIADFGVAKMLGMPPGAEGNDSQIAGTPQYMAPEQRTEPGRTDHRADVYSLGIVLYEMLTGQLPSDKLQPPSSRLSRIQIDVRLDEIVLRALETLPELRYQTARELGAEIETVVATTGGFGPPRLAQAAQGPDNTRTSGLARLVGVILLMASLMVGVVRMAQERSAYDVRFASMSRRIHVLQKEWQTAKGDEFAARTALSRLEAGALTARTEKETQQFEIDRIRLANEMSAADARGDDILEQVQATTTAINRLRFPTAANLIHALWPAGLMLFSSLLLFRPKPQRSGKMR